MTSNEKLKVIREVVNTLDDVDEEEREPYRYALVITTWDKTFFRERNNNKATLNVSFRTRNLAYKYALKFVNTYGEMVLKCEQDLAINYMIKERSYDTYKRILIVEHNCIDSEQDIEKVLDGI